MVEEESHEIRLDWLISLFFATMCVSSVGSPLIEIIEGL
jgi:hypothetical protein